MTSESEPRVDPDVVVDGERSGRRVPNRLPAIDFVPPRPSIAVRRKFDALVQQWLLDTGDLSVLDKAFMHPAYLQIIGMGVPAIPLLLDELRNRTGYWFLALRSITGYDPVQEGDNYDAAVERWLQWGRDLGWEIDVHGGNESSQPQTRGVHS
jgi:hypothetical protein